MAETLAPSRDDPDSLDIDAFRSRMKELSDMRRSLLDSSEAVCPDAKQLLEDFISDIQRRSEQIDAEEPSVSALGIDDLETYVESLKNELLSVEEKKREVLNEIEVLKRTITEDSAQLDSSLLEMEHSLRQINSEGIDDCQDGIPNDGSVDRGDASEDFHFKILELDSLMEKTSAYVRSLEDLQYDFKRNEAIGEIEDRFSDIKVIDFEGNCIRLTLKTRIESSDLLQKLGSRIEPSCIDHELLIEVNAGTMELNKLKVFPTDVSLDDVVETAKSSRFSLQWLLRHIQQKILVCTLRSSFVKVANNSRRSIEYTDRDATITAHLVGGINAYIKVPQGWPVSNSALKLVSAKSLNASDTSISLGLLCKIKELANALDEEIRWDPARFFDAIEEILIRETQSMLQTN